MKKTRLTLTAGGMSINRTKLIPSPLKWLLTSVVLVLLFGLSARRGSAQAAAEYAHAVSGAASLGASVSKALSTDGAAKKLDSALSPDQNTGSGSAHLVGRTSESPEVINRKALEQRAGKDAAKLTLKSVPDKALVIIGGKVVGSTPLLLTLAPGKYKVDMQGQRMEFGSRQVELAPQESREVVLRLESRYPTVVHLR